MTSLPCSEVSKGEYLVMLAALPGAAPEKFGILLLDPDSDRLYVRLRRDITEFAGAEADWFECLADDIRAKSQELGARQYLAWMESTLSNTLLVSERSTVLVDGYERTADRLYAEHIHPRVLPFRTHLPLYGFSAAAGNFRAGVDVHPDGWIEVPSNIPLTPDMFVAQVLGHSMEPTIPDKSLCVFRTLGDSSPASYAGKVVLLESYHHGKQSTFVVSRYRRSVDQSTDRKRGEVWLHEHFSTSPTNTS